MFLPDVQSVRAESVEPGQKYAKFIKKKDFYLLHNLWVQIQSFLDNNILKWSICHEGIIYLLHTLWYLMNLVGNNIQLHIQLLLLINCLRNNNALKNWLN